jgi:hypothetical protein
MDEQMALDIPNLVRIRRSLFLTFICVFIWFTGIMTLASYKKTLIVMSQSYDPLNQISIYHPFYFNHSLMLISFVGIWLMRKWTIFFLLVNPLLLMFFYTIIGDSWWLAMWSKPLLTVLGFIFPGLMHMLVLLIYWKRFR